MFRKFNEISISGVKKEVKMEPSVHYEHVARNDLWAWRHCYHSQTGKHFMAKSSLRSIIVLVS